MMSSSKSVAVRSIAGGLTTVLAAMTLVGCGSGKEERGLRYMPDMYRSPAYKSQEPMVIPSVDEEGRPIQRQVPAMLPPPAGTVDRSGEGVYSIPVDQPEAADGLVNPLVPDARTLQLGRDKYDTFCIVCHGRDGKAENGYVAKAFLGIPNVVSPIVQEYSDGRLYHFITAGKGRMPSYGAQLLPEERWAVVHYVRALNEASGRVDDPALTGQGEAFEPLPEPVPEYRNADWSANDTTRQAP